MGNLSTTFPVTAVDINIYHARQIADQQITYAVECVGNLDIDRVRRNLALLRAAPPILSTVVRAAGFHLSADFTSGHAG
ncbi:MAG TPA: hypothetical protein VMP08_05395 [Anaerolineae bacterium]|nr:hypothetical protein [Anaerolineae bacterium]